MSIDRLRRWGSVSGPSHPPPHQEASFFYRPFSFCLMYVVLYTPQAFGLVVVFTPESKVEVHFIFQYLSGLEGRLPQLYVYLIFC